MSGAELGFYPLSGRRRGRDSSEIPLDAVKRFGLGLGLDAPHHSQCILIDKMAITPTILEGGGNCFSDYFGRVNQNCRTVRQKPHYRSSGGGANFPMPRS